MGASTGGCFAVRPRCAAGPLRGQLGGRHLQFQIVRGAESCEPCAPCAAYPRILARAPSSHRLAPMGAGPVHPRTAVNNPDARLCHDHWAPPALTNATTVAHTRRRSQLKSRCRTGDQATREPGNQACIPPRRSPVSLVPWYLGPLVSLFRQANRVRRAESASPAGRL